VPTTFIEYACVVSGREIIHCARPKTGLRYKANQYVLAFENDKYAGRGYGRSVVCVTGDWEWESIQCSLWKLKEFLLSSPGRQSRRFTAGGNSPDNDDGVWIDSWSEIAWREQADPVARITLGLDGNYSFHAAAATWPHMNKSTFRLYRQQDDLADLGQALDRLEATSFEPVIGADMADWFLPRWLDESASTAEFLAREQAFPLALRAIEEGCPSGLGGLWRWALQELVSFPGDGLWKAACCSKCQGVFARIEKWKKVCLGCYRGEKPDALPKSLIDAEVERLSAPWFQYHEHDHAIQEAD